MEPITNETETRYRALMTNSKEFKEKREEAIAKSTKWYDEKPPLEIVKEEAKKEGFDMVIIESMVVTMEVYEVKE